MLPFDPPARAPTHVAPARRPPIRSGGGLVHAGRDAAAPATQRGTPARIGGPSSPPLRLVPRTRAATPSSPPPARNAAGTDGGLETLRRAVLTLVPRSADDQRDLTLRQVAVLLLVYEPGQKPRTAGALADLLGVPRPAITRVLDRLGELELARRDYGPPGSRCVRVQRTRRGSALLSRLRRRLATGPSDRGDGTRS
jgi:DNA-binding MarR family transcriptional regulator